MCADKCRNQPQSWFHKPFRKKWFTTKFCHIIIIIFFLFFFYWNLCTVLRCMCPKSLNKKSQISKLYFSTRRKSSPSLSPTNHRAGKLSSSFSLSLSLSLSISLMYTRDLEALLDEREDEGFCSRLVSELNGDLDSTSSLLKEDLVIVTILCICTH